MVQEFHVVRCYSCSLFQSQQVRKDKKFGCKMCGAKQSVKKEYGRGTGKDCRVHVQKLNSLQGSLEAEQEQKLESQLEEEEQLEDWTHDTLDYPQRYSDCPYEIDSDLVNQNHGFWDEAGNVPESVSSSETSSKWSSYLTSEADDLDDAVENRSISITVNRRSCSLKEGNNKEIENTSNKVHMDNDCNSIQKRPHEGMLTVGRKGLSPFQPPHLKSRLLHPSSDPVSVQHELGPIRTQRTPFQDSRFKGKGRLSSSPYPSVSGSGPSRVNRSESTFESYDYTEPNSSSIVNVIHQSGNTQMRKLGKIDDRIVAKAGFVNNVQNKIMPLREKPGNLTYADRSVSSSENDVQPFSYLTNNVSLGEPTNQISKSKLRHSANLEMCKSVEDTQTVSKSVQIESKNHDRKKQIDFVNCIKNVSSAPFKKYELVDDEEDINFDL